MRKKSVGRCCKRWFQMRPIFRIVKLSVFLLFGVFYPLSADSFVGVNENGLILSQQTNTISGRVVDDIGEPLPGVTVVIKGTTQGTVTDMNGEYELPDVPENATLQYSFVGMTMQEILVQGQSIINVKMVSEDLGLEEVVVVGYGSQTKSSLTTAVSSVEGEDLVKKATPDIRKSLQGAVPGLNIIDQGGSPGNEDVQFRIRGITSINSTEPLVLIDGVEQNINSVDANAIESISVLKDAASTSIYGSRGANGVILITTKTGSEGKISLTYNGYYGTSYPITWPEPLDTRSYMEMQNLVYSNSGLDPVYNDIDGYIENMEKYPDLFPKAFPDWDEFFDWAPVTKHSLVISGGTKAVSSMFNLSYEDIGGVLPGRHSKKYQIRGNNQINITDNIKTFLNVSMSRNDWYEPRKSDQWAYQSIFNMKEFMLKQYPDGTYGSPTGNANSNIWLQSDLNYRGKTQTYDDNAVISMGADIKFLKDFNFKMNYSINASKKRISENNPSYYVYSYWNENAVTGKNEINKYSEERIETFRTTLDDLLSYQKTFNERHEVNVLLGYSEDEYKLTGVLAGGQDFYNNEIRNLSQGDPGNRTVENDLSEWALRSFFGRASYAFDHKYFLEMNARYDGSSRFPKGNKYTFFPSTSVAWRLSEENFWEPLRETVSSFKVRYSYGETGNQSISNYSYIPQLNVKNAYVFYNPNSNTESLVTGVGQTDLASTELSWETTTQNNVGIDIGILQNKLTYSIDLYKKVTDGILLDVPVAAVVGLKPSKTNAGTIENKGWEMVATWKDNFGDLKYSISGNVSYVKDEITDFGGLPKQIFYNNRYFRAKGTSLYSLYGYRNDGFFKDQADIDASPAYGNKASILPGDIKYKDISGPNGVPDGIISAEYDMTDLGNGMPTFFFGTTINVDWKGWDMTMNWQGAGGHEKPLYGKILEMGGWPGYMPHYANEDYWTGPEDTDARFPVPHIKPNNNIQPSDFWLVDASYLRLKSLTVGYTLPESWVSKIGLQNVRLYVNGTNLLTFSELYKKWDLDPEGNISGLRYNYFPQTKSINGGIVVNF